MYYRLTNQDKINILKKQSIKYTLAKYTLFIDGIDVTNVSDENFEIVVKDQLKKF